MGHDVEQVFQRQVRVPARHRFAVRDVEEHFDRLAEHGSFLSQGPFYSIAITPFR
jgi:hypothetical protein